MFNLITIEDFAKEINKPKSTVYSWKDKGNIPLNCFKQIGGSWFVKVEEMKEFLNNS